MTGDTICRTLAEVRAAGQRDGQADPPLTQEQADLIWALLRPVTAKARAAA